MENNQINVQSHEWEEELIKLSDGTKREKSSPI